MDRNHSLRQIAEHVRSARRNRCDSECAHDPQRLSISDQHIFRRAVQDTAHLQRAAVWPELRAARHARAADDVYSDFEKSLVDRFVAAVDHTGKATARAKEAAELLRSWDGRVTAESPAANIIVF